MTSYRDINLNLREVPGFQVNLKKKKRFWSWIYSTTYLPALISLVVQSPYEFCTFTDILIWWLSVLILQTLTCFKVVFSKNLGGGSSITVRKQTQQNHLPEQTISNALVPFQWLNINAHWILTKSKKPATGFQSFSQWISKQSSHDAAGIDLIKSQLKAHTQLGYFQYKKEVFYESAIIFRHNIACRCVIFRSCFKYKCFCTRAL